MMAATALRHAVRIGLLLGTVLVYLAIVGLLLMIHGRWLIVDILTVGRAALIAIGPAAGVVVARGEARRTSGQGLVGSLIAGAIAGFLPAVLVLSMQTIDLRPLFISLSPALFDMLTFGLDLPLGLVFLVCGGVVLAALGVLLVYSPPIIKKPLIVGCATVAFFGVFQELLLSGRSLVDVEPHGIARLDVMQVPEGRRIFSRLAVEENLAMGALRA